MIKGANHGSNCASAAMFKGPACSPLRLEINAEYETFQLIRS